MKMKTTFLERSDFQKELARGIENFEQIYSKSEIVLNENIFPIKRNSYHFIGQLLKKLKKNNRSEHVLAFQIFNAVYRSEVTSAGSGEVAFLFAIELTKQLTRNPMSFTNQTKSINDFTKYMERLKENLQQQAEIATEADIREAIARSCEDELLAKTIWEAVNLAGLEGKIFVENGKQSNYVVELKEGYSFKLNPYKWMLEKGPWEKYECKVLIIDGLIEKVSELDQILTKAFETKQPLMIIGMGFSEEVGMTLRANMERGLLDVQPIRIPTDLDSLNVVNDLATVCGTVPVSSFKGDMVACVKWEDLPTVDKVRLSLGQTVIENSKTRGAVSLQIKSLLEKRYENNLYEDIQLLIDKRMRSLVSNAVNIFLPEMTSAQNDAERVQIDIALRQTKTILNYGTTNFKKAIGLTKPQNDLEKILYKALSKIELEKQYIPTLSAIMGVTMAGKAILMLYASSGLVAIDV